jgi:predicted alpha/beta-hydrolase family hydrolase
VFAIGHGAGGGVDARDILAVRTALVPAGVTVVRVTQPYRVAGRRAPAPVGQLDAAWLAVVKEVMSGYGDTPLIAAGRSSGARVACRTAVASGASGVVALAFPVHLPGRPEKSRLPELDGAGVPTLVVNGERDPFGVPPPAPGRDVVVVPGAVHDLRKDLRAVAGAVVEWLVRHGWAALPR